MNKNITKLANTPCNLNDWDDVTKETYKEYAEFQPKGKTQKPHEHRTSQHETLLGHQHTTASSLQRWWPEDVSYTCDCGIGAAPGTRGAAVLQPPQASVHIQRQHTVKG